MKTFMLLVEVLGCVGVVMLMVGFLVSTSKLRSEVADLRAQLDDVATIAEIADVRSQLAIMIAELNQTPTKTK